MILRSLPGICAWAIMTPDGCWKSGGTSVLCPPPGRGLGLPSLLRPLLPGYRRRSAPAGGRRGKSFSPGLFERILPPIAHELEVPDSAITPACSLPCWKPGPAGSDPSVCHLLSHRFLPPGIGCIGAASFPPSWPASHGPLPGHRGFGFSPDPVAGRFPQLNIFPRFFRSSGEFC